MLKPGRNCWCAADYETGGLLVDARDYYRAFYQAAQQAERRILVAGWQFDSQVPLLRGADVHEGWEPELLPFLKQLTERKPELEIAILAWDYSIVYALEREWLQRVIFDFKTNPHIRFQFDEKHAAGASHHQKFVVIDGTLAFVGGIDLCDSRWDDRRHLPENPARLTLRGEPQKPYHDLMAFVTGAAATRLEELFQTRWRLATGEALNLTPPEPLQVAELPHALPLRCGCVAISRTQGEQAELGLAGVQEILHLYEDAIAGAEALIYIETQYFTARAVGEALIRRMQDKARSRLQLIIVMPRGADSPKEDLVLGRTQDKLLGELAETAKANGHTLRAYYTSSQTGERELATFIHSKLLIVDDRILSVGSANLTNRSMHLDSELNLSWECGDGDGRLGDDIKRARASLLAEHTGLADNERSFDELTGLIERLDSLAHFPGNRLKPRPSTHLDEDAAADGLLRRAFDPEQPLDETNLADLLGLELPRASD